MTNNPGSVLENTFSSHYRRIILFFRRCRVTILKDSHRSDRWVKRCFHPVFFKPNPVGFEAGRHTECTVHFLQGCCKYIYLFII